MSDPYFAYSAALRIIAPILDLASISTEMGLQPTHMHRRGESRGPRSPAYKHDHWSFQAPVPEDRPLHNHIETLWSHVKPRKYYLLQLKQSCTVDVFCGYRSNSDTAGFEVPARALSMFVELDVPFGVSVIITG